MSRRARIRKRARQKRKYAQRPKQADKPITHPTTGLIGKLTQRLHTIAFREVLETLSSKT